MLSSGGSGIDNPPADNTSSIVGMIRDSNLFSLNTFRHANRTCRSGSEGFLAATRNATGTTVSN